MSSISGFTPTAYKNHVQSAFTVTGTGLPNPAAVGLSETGLGGVTWNVSAASVSTSADGTKITFNATPTCSGSLGSGSITLAATNIVSMAVLFHTQGSSYS